MRGASHAGLQASLLLLAGWLCTLLAPAAGRPGSWVEAGPEQQADLSAGRCPLGVPVLSVPSSSSVRRGDGGGLPAVFGANLTYRLKPRTFAVAAEVAWDFDLATKGSWEAGEDGSRTWRLCIAAPGAQSLTLLFNALRLPLLSELFIYSPVDASQGRLACGYGCQRLTLHSVRRAGATLAAPTPGAAAMLEYWQPAGVRRGRARPPLSIRVQAVLLGIAPLPLAAMQQQQQLQTSTPGAAAEEMASRNASLAVGASSVGGSGGLGGDPARVRSYLGTVVEQARGRALPCQPNVECDSAWGAEANAVVLLVGVDGTQGFYCTATLVNAPDNVQYLITANHCLGQSTDATTHVFWGLLFDYTAQCGASNGTARPQYQLLQGVSVVWNNELTDVMLLRLDDEIPEAFNPYFLGWDASGWVQPKAGSVCIHHPVGDTKKIAYTKEELVSSSYRIADPTHYLATWERGGMEIGSSGAMLIDATTKLGLGTLTGGREDQTCTKGEDVYGSLYVAWKLGLGEYLGGAAGMSGPSRVGPRQATDDGPGLIVDPDLLVLQERGARADLQITLSEEPPPGAQLLLNASVVGSDGAVSITLFPTKLSFTADNWDQFQRITVGPGDDAVQGNQLAFSILLELRSSQDADFYKRRSVPGVRLDDDIPEGSTPSQPLGITLQRDKPFTAGGSLAAGGAQPPVKLGRTSLAEFQAAVPQGSVVYYALWTAQALDLTVQACSQAAPLRLYVFSPAGIMVWSSSESCTIDTSANPCIAFEDVQTCSGFRSLQLSGTDGAGPYLLAIASRGQAAASYNFMIQGAEF